MFWLAGLLVPLAILWFLSRLVFRRTEPFATRLTGLLNLCAAEGIISSDQMGRILDRLKQQKAGVQIRGTTWIAIFAGLFVAAGISLVIAHNWDQIGPVTRVVSFLFFFAAVGEAAIRLEDRSIAWSLPFSILWFFFPILGIGLFAQTFQLSGDPIRPFLVWILLTLPLAWFSRRRALPVPHLLLIVGVLFFGSFTPNQSLSLVAHYPFRETLPFSPWAWLGALFLIGLAFAESFKLLNSAHRKHVLGMTLLWLTLLVIMPTRLEIKNGGWLYAAATSASTLWLALNLLLRSSLPERVPSYLSVVGCTYAMTFLWHLQSPFQGNASPFGLVLVCGMAATALIVCLVFAKERFSPQPNWHYFFQVLFLGPLLLSFGLPHVNGEGIRIIAILANLFLFVGALGAMWHGSLMGSDLRINLGVIILLLLLVTRFFDVLGDLVQGGIGFIVSGLFLGLVAYVLGKTRKHLMNRSGTGPSR
ncbi:MAG TPA: DUF2157 domain-containing protein [Bdellovibrionota bacterium]|nr:DUF2157 domain-containing protein [Bdellovibrionota bacterium]